mmetsp:Transcript_19751/g.40300  ORF Transcript_19751/g.40300 Transcript_19751/m.40300 type:complete len:110 (+) Transcript_19751:276-605(+)
MLDRCWNGLVEIQSELVLVYVPGDHATVSRLQACRLQVPGILRRAFEKFRNSRTICAKQIVPLFVLAGLTVARVQRRRCLSDTLLSARARAGKQLAASAPLNGNICDYK